ncbi:MAG: glycosyltransferase family 2 protein [Pseudomonadota bacterium]
MNQLSPSLSSRPVCILPAHPQVSFVIPAFNEEENIARALQSVNCEAQQLVASYEIILVDDGSSDATFARARTCCVGMPLRIIRLSRNFGKEQALMAGLVAAKGEAVITIDADRQEPLSALKKMLDYWRNGYDMAYAVRAHRRDESAAKRMLTSAFYKALNFGNDTPIPVDARDFRLMDRKVVDTICSLKERNRFMKGLYGWVGFKSVAIPVELREREEGSSKFGFAGLFQLALTGLTSFTAWPLRLWTGIGSVVALASLTYGFYLTARTIAFGADLPGWSTLAVGMFLLSGVQLISIGVLGEYVARIFTEVKGRPGFIVDYEYNAEVSQK